MRVVSSIVALSMAALLGAERAHAQGVCPSFAQAEDAEARGMAANQTGDHEGALHRFEQSYALCRGARAQGRMAIALMALGRWGEADRWMRSALTVQGDPWVTSNRASLEQQLSVIAQHVGELLVMGEGGAGQVLVDGRPLASFPMESSARVTAGSVVIRVESLGRHPVERIERVDVGRLSRVQVTLVSTGVTEAPRGEAPAGENGRGLRQALAWTSVGLGAVGLGVGIWATQERINLRNAYDTQCPSGFPGDRQGACNDLLARVSEGGIVAAQVGGFIAAGAFVTTAVVLFATMPDASPSARAFTCGPGPGTFGVGCEGRF